MTLRKSDIILALQAQAPDREKLKEVFTWTDKYRKPRLQKNERPEEKLQIECVDYLRQLPDILFFHPLQNVYRGKNSNEGAFLAYMARMKRIGHVGGVPDLIIWFRNKDDQHVTCMAELKVGYNKQSDAQKEFENKAVGKGCFYEVIKSVDDLVNLLRSAGYNN